MSNEPHPPSPEVTTTTPSLLELLPIELKHEVFSYSLLGRDVKTPILGGGPTYKYRFETSMMLVNKRLSAEAKAYLYGHNTFVLVGLVYPVVQDMAVSVLTVVSRHGLRFFDNHVLRVHLDLENKWGKALTRTIPDREGPAAMDWFLMLHEDLSHLCEMFQLFNHNQASNQVFILSAPDVLPIQSREAGIPHKSTHRMLVELRDTRYLRHDLSRNDELDRQKQLLAPLGIMANSFQYVSIKGGDRVVTNDIVNRTTSRLVWPEAMNWDLYRLLRRQVSRIDALVRIGDRDLAHMASRYAHLAHHTVGISTTLFNTIHDDTPLFFRNLPTESVALSKCHQVAVTTVIMECFLKAAGICLQEEKTDRFKSCIILATNRLENEQVSGAFNQALSPHLFSLLLHSQAVLNAKKGQYDRTRDGLEIAFHSCPSDDVASIKHDQDMLAAFTASQLQSTPLTLATSAIGQRFKNFFTTAFDPAFSSATYANFVIPERFQGWVDTQHQVPPHLIQSLHAFVDSRVAAAGRD